MPISNLVGPYGIRLDCLRIAAWGDKSAAEEILRMEVGFDCFIVNRGGTPESFDDPIVSAISSRVGGWVEVFGDFAEFVHDAIDAESVRTGRQSAVGEGNPMTAWYHGFGDAEIASYVWTGGQGESLRKALVLVGPPSMTAAALDSVVNHQRLK